MAHPQQNIIFRGTAVKENATSSPATICICTKTFSSVFVTTVGKERRIMVQRLKEVMKKLHPVEHESRNCISTYLGKAPLLDFM